MPSELSLKDAINLYLRKSRLDSKVRSYKIEDVWEEIMGKTIAKYTDKIQIVQGTLFISTVVAPLKNELTYQKSQIIKRVNEALGENVIHEVVIKWYQIMPMKKPSGIPEGFLLFFERYTEAWI